MFGTRTVDANGNQDKFKGWKLIVFISPPNISLQFWILLSLRSETTRRKISFIFVPNMPAFWDFEGVAWWLCNICKKRSAFWLSFFDTWEENNTVFTSKKWTWPKICTDFLKIWPDFQKSVQISKKLARFSKNLARFPKIWPDFQKNVRFQFGMYFHEFWNYCADYFIGKSIGIYVFWICSASML